jgi:hypothetical protein
MPENSIPKWQNPAIHYDESLLLAENDTLQKISTTLSSLEIAIESWEKAGKRPAGLRRLIIEFRNFKSELERWQNETPTSRSSKDSAARKERLLWFTEICKRYGDRFMKKGGLKNAQVR